MKFYSTNQKSPLVSLKEAVMNGLAPDNGLYMPTIIPRLPKSFFKKAVTMSFQDIALEASKIFLDDVPPERLRKIVYEAFNFKVPLLKLDQCLYAFELFHGPTGAFKDFAARFMASLFAHFREQSQKKITILVATSGDTGSAVASGFLNAKGIKVVILYPSGKVSPLQEKQLTGMEGNIIALEVQGSFDDCQQMVKQAFLDRKLRQAMTLASANSINVARLLPQSFYYLYLCSQLNKMAKPIIVSVPSGNFGNLTAGLIAKRMGAPIYKFIAATNENDVVPKYLQTGHFIAKPSLTTISNAMDVGNPSNFARMLALYSHDVEKMRQDVFGVSFSDEETSKAMTRVFNEYNYIMDPHGAVAYLGLLDFQKNYPGLIGVFLETAHPIKFSGVVEEAIGQSVPLPNWLELYADRKKQAILIKNKFFDLKEILLNQ